MNQDLDNLKALMGSGADPETIKKALAVTDGFVGINLEAVAKLMLPLYAGLRNRLPADKPTKGGTQAIWRTQIGYGGFDFGANMGTAFHGIGGAVAGAAITIQADYKTQAVAGSVEFEAIPMAQGFDDPLAIETSRSLSTLMRLEELIVLGGNEVALAAPAPVATPSTATAVNTFAAGNWHVKVTALTLQGTIANAAGNSNTGESVVSASILCTAPGGDIDFIDVYWPPVPGAVGYKVYCETAAANSTWNLCIPATDLKYRKITAGATDLALFGDAIVTPTGQTYVTVKHVQITRVPTSAVVPAGADGSANANVFEGMIPWCEKRTMYGQNLGADHISYNADGAPLTTAGSGVSEFDSILQQLWMQWVINPTLIITSPAGASSLTDKLIAANNAAMYRLEIQQERGSFTGGVFVGGYLNKFAASMMGYQPATIPVWAHPYLPDGTFLFLTERIPYQYSREARGFALDTLIPYTYFELARVDRSFPFSTFWNQTMKCYHPLAQAYIAGARVVN